MDTLGLSEKAASGLSKKVCLCALFDILLGILLTLSEREHTVYYELANGRVLLGFGCGKAGWLDEISGLGRLSPLLRQTLRGARRKVVSEQEPHPRY